jgi:phage terminase large subunit
MPKSKFSFRDTEATRKIFGLRKRIRAVCGGTSASKTISILFWLIDYCQTRKNKKVDVMSESYPHLEDGAIKDFKSIMIDRGYWDDKCWNETKHIYRFETETVLKFLSIDKLGKAHGPRRDVLFINEANNIAFNIYEMLEVRTKEVVILDWNPSTEFWYYSEVKDKVDHDFLTLTYLDCLEVLDQRIVASIESRKGNKNWWRVYGMGLLGELEGKIYNDWQIIESMPDFPHEARLWRYGLDFGYTNDPTAIVAVYEYNGGYILDEITYQKGLSNQNIADILKNQEKALVVADSAEPKSIDEIYSYGINIIGATKGRDSVMQGIQYVQEQRISMTKRSLNIIKAYRNYLFLVDKDGKTLNVPDDTVHEWSNCMDSARYAIANGRKVNIEPQTDFGGVDSLIEGMLA